MSKPIRSARGVEVDFDLLKIKEQMAATPKAAPVKARENFIDQRFKRRIKKASVAPTIEVEAVVEKPAKTTKARISKTTTEESNDE